MHNEIRLLWKGEKCVSNLSLFWNLDFIWDKKVAIKWTTSFHSYVRFELTLTRVQCRDQCDKCPAIPPWRTKIFHMNSESRCDDFLAPLKQSVSSSYFPTARTSSWNKRKNELRFIWQIVISSFLSEQNQNNSSSSKKIVKIHLLQVNNFQKVKMEKL